MEIIAHRGYSARAPENTLAAVRAALEAGADAVEFDLHVAACGTPVLFHDAQLSRTSNGTGPLRRRALEELRELDAGSWFGSEFAGERIPTLSEALEACRARAQRVYAEVKGFREAEDLDRMVRDVRDMAMEAHTVFIAMNWSALDRIRGRAPDLCVGYIVSEAGEVDEALSRARGDENAMVDFKAALLLDDPTIAERCRDEGIDVAVWTVDDVAEADALADQGIERITTNEVERLLSWRAGRG